MNCLTSLNLQHTPIDDKGLAPIVALVGSDELRLSRTDVTGASYAYLKRLSKLKGLALNDTQVGDEGSEALGELKTLVRLDHQLIPESPMSLWLISPDSRDCEP